MTWEMSLRSRLARGSWLPSAGGPQHATTAGMLAARMWFRARALSAPGLLRWHAEILLDVVDQPARESFDERTDTRFRLEIYSEEWGFLFCHAGLASWIRITDIPFVHGRDDFGLLSSTPALKDIGGLLRGVEHRHRIHFRRRHALVLTNIPNAETPIRRWTESL
jgi:hypothetical protein